LFIYSDRTQNEILSVLLVLHETRHGLIYSNPSLSTDIVPEKDHSWEDWGHWGIWEV